MTNLEFATMLVQRLNFLLCSPHLKKAMKALLEFKVRIPPRMVEPPWRSAVSSNNELSLIGVLNSLVGLYCRDQIGIECVVGEHENDISFSVVSKEEPKDPETSHMKAILEFNLPDAKLELKWAYHGSDYYMVLSQLDNNLRGTIKYGAALDHDSDVPEELRVHYEKVRTHLWHLLEDYGVDLNE
jgi:hypothetical protein